MTSGTSIVAIIASRQDVRQTDAACAGLASRAVGCGRAWGIDLGEADSTKTGLARRTVAVKCAGREVRRNTDAESTNGRGVAFGVACTGWEDAGETESVGASLAVSTRVVVAAAL